MAYWNHFAQQKYKQISFKDVAVGEKFRMDKFKNKKARRNIVMIKTGTLSYQELRSKREYTLLSSELEVSSYNILLTSPSTPTP